MEILAPLIFFIVVLVVPYLMVRLGGDARRTSKNVANRLGFEIEVEKEVLGSNQFSLFRQRHQSIVGVLDGHKVEVDRRARLRQLDDAPKGAFRFIVSFEALPEKFRLTTPDNAHSSAVELHGKPEFVIETEAPQLVEKIMTVTRRRILDHVHERWPTFEVRHNRIIVVVPDIDSDPDAVEETIRQLVQAAKAFTADRYLL